MRTQSRTAMTLHQNKHLTSLPEQFNLLSFPAGLIMYPVFTLHQVSQLFIRLHSVRKCYRLVVLCCHLLPPSDSSAFRNQDLYIFNYEKKGISSTPNNSKNKGVCSVLQYFKSHQFNSSISPNHNAMETCRILLQLFNIYNRIPYVHQIV